MLRVGDTAPDNSFHFKNFCVFIKPLNPLHSNISKYILHTVLYTFPKVLTRRIYLTIKSFFIW